MIEDLDDPAGLGAFIGEVHAKILQRLECVAVVTNGGVRDLPAVRKMGFPMFAGNAVVSHAYAHIFDFGGPVRVGGLEVRRGDLIHADFHGVQTIPRASRQKSSCRARHLAKAEAIDGFLRIAPLFARGAPSKGQGNRIVSSQALQESETIRRV